MSCRTAFGTAFDVEPERNSWTCEYVSRAFERMTAS